MLRTVRHIWIKLIHTQEKWNYKRLRNKEKHSLLFRIDDKQTRNNSTVSYFLLSRAAKVNTLSLPGSFLWWLYRVLVCYARDFKSIRACDQAVIVVCDGRAHKKTYISLYIQSRINTGFAPAPQKYENGGAGNAGNAARGPSLRESPKNLRSLIQLIKDTAWRRAFT